MIRVRAFMLFNRDNNFNTYRTEKQMYLFWFSVRVREVHQDQKGLKEIKGQK